MTLADREIPTGVAMGSGSFYSTPNGSYTIPAGKYALVSAQVIAIGTNDKSGFSINSLPVMQVTSEIIVSGGGTSGNTRVSESSIYKLPQGTTISGDRWCAQLFDMITDS